MKVGEHGQVTIPKEMQERSGIRPGTAVEFDAVEGRLILRKVERKLNLDKWQGYCAPSFAELGNPSVDEVIEDMRGR